MVRGSVYATKLLQSVQPDGKSSIEYTVEVNSSQLSRICNVRLAVYDLLGREVAVLIDERKTAGRYEVGWDATGFPSGVYICRMVAGDFVAYRKTLLIK